MRIFFITFISIIFFLAEANSHIAHYKNFKNIKMEIFRNDKLIGNNDYYFNQKNKLLMVKNIINF